MAATLETEISALRRIAHVRLPNAAVARQRVKIKRRLRAAGWRVEPSMTTRELVEAVAIVNRAQAA